MRFAAIGVLFFILPGAMAQWQKQSSPSNKDLYGLYFKGEIAYAVGYNSALYKSVDSGKTWSALSPAIPTHLRAVVFTSADTGFICGENARIQKTTNGGLNWTQKYVRTAAYAYAMAFQNQYGVAVGKDMLAVRSSDFGESWQVDSTLVSNKKLNSVCITPSGTCWAVGDSGYILKKKLTDHSWLNLKYPSKIHFNSIGHIGDSLLYICGGMPDSAQSGNFINIFLQSRDSGKTWKTTSISEMKIITSAVFFSADSGFFAGSNGLICKSYQPFTTRGLQLSGSPSSLNALAFSNGIGLIVGDGGLILRTRNFGGSGLSLDPLSARQVQVYPNPSAGRVHIRCEENIAQVTCYTLNGQAIDIRFDPKQKQIDQLPQGRYVLLIQTESGRQYREIIDLY